MNLGTEGQEDLTWDKVDFDLLSGISNADLDIPVGQAPSVAPESQVQVDPVIGESEDSPPTRDFSNRGSLKNSTSPSTSGNGHRCSGCGKTFTKIGNRNKHFQYDCAFGRRAKFNCRNPGCGKEVTRKKYRDEHERKHCAFR